LNVKFLILNKLFKKDKYMKNRKRIMNATLMIISLAFFGFAFMAQKKITVKGSDTMVILAQKWAEVYMKSHKEVAIQVTGGGSGVGISALINGTTDIANASRPMSQTELQKLKERYNTLGVEIPCAKDGITIYVNDVNKVNELSIKQLSGIFSGKIRNWKEVGGVDADIKLYGRENSSGTYVFFKDNVVKGDYAPSCQTLPGTAAVVNAVKKDKNGIGYGGAAFAEGVRHCKVKKDEKSTAYFANSETIKNGTYPISRYLFMYLKSKPAGDMKKYIDWILSPEGQKLVTEVGYFPVK
jgi:phosphate transport system substrate-binding protein